MRSVSVSTAAGGFSLGQGFSWPDPDIEGTLVISQPSIDPELWAEYAAGAVRSYSKRGVECALDIEALRSGDDTIMFGAVVNDSGHVVGGYRAIALRSADDSHAVEEWAGHPGQQDVRQMIAERVPLWGAGNEDRLGHRRRRPKSVSDHRPGAQLLLHDGDPGFPIHHVHGRHPGAEQLAVVRIRGGAHSGDAVSQRALPNQDDVVEPARFRQPREAGPARQNRQ